MSLKPETNLLISDIQNEIDDIRWKFRKAERRQENFEIHRRKSLMKMSAAQTKLSARKPVQSKADEIENAKVRSLLKKYDHLTERHDHSEDPFSINRKMSAVVREFLANAYSLTEEQVQKVVESGRGHLLPTQVLMKYMDNELLREKVQVNDPEVSMFLQSVGSRKLSAVDAEQMQRLEESSGIPVKRASILDNDPDEIQRRAMLLIAQKKEERRHLLRKLVVVGNAISAWYRAALLWKAKTRRAHDLERKFDGIRDQVLTQRTNEVIVVKEPWRAYELGMTAGSTPSTGRHEKTSARILTSANAFERNCYDSESSDPEDELVEEVLHTDASAAYPFSQPNSQAHVTMFDIRPALEQAFAQESTSPRRSKSPSKVLVPLLNLAGLPGIDAKAGNASPNPVSGKQSALPSARMSVPATPSASNRPHPGPSAAQSPEPSYAKEDPIEALAKRDKSARRGLPKVAKIMLATKKIDVSKDAERLLSMRPDVISNIAFIDRRTPDGIILVEKVQRELQKNRHKGKELDPAALLESLAPPGILPPARSDSRNSVTSGTVSPLKSQRAYPHEHFERALHSPRKRLSDLVQTSRV